MQLGGKSPPAEPREETRPFFIGGRVSSFEAQGGFTTCLSRGREGVEDVAMKGEGKVGTTGKEGIVGVCQI
jgi:hypothetical protein